jgi:hypothetical protein
VSSQVVDLIGGGVCGGVGPVGADSNIVTWIRAVPSSKPALNLQFVGPSTAQDLVDLIDALDLPGGNGLIAKIDQLAPYCPPGPPPAGPFRAFCSQVKNSPNLSPEERSQLLDLGAALCDTLCP